MTALEWNKVGERIYETGVDRGVLYLPDGTAVPWNGLTEVSESRGRDIKSYYIDGIKYLDHHVPGSFTGKIKAYTYPVELEELMGNPEFAPGVIAYDQPTSLFNLSYRTLVGNDVDGIDHGYKIHILYNLLASPSDVGLQTVGENVEPQLFEWSLSGTPPTMYGIRPTAHLAVDSRRIAPELLATIEEALYGSDTVDPALPDLITLLGMAEA